MGTKTKYLKESKSTYSTQQTFKEISQGITGVGVFFLLFIFPVYTHDMYFDILGARYVLFKITVIILMVLQILLGILYLIIDNDNNNVNGGALTRLANALTFKNLKEHLIITDIFAVMMLLVCAISTYYSEKPVESFFGNAGRYQGLECWIIYFVLYVIVSRTFKFKKIYLDCAILMGMFIGIWGYSDYFFCNWFGFFNNVSGGQRGMFMASIGNLNTYTNYTTMIFAISGSMFLIEENNLKSIFYFLGAFISLVASVFGLSDNIIIAIGIFFVVSPYLFVKEKKNLVRWFYLATSTFFSINLLHYMDILIPRHNGFPSTLRDFSEMVYFRYIFFIFLIVSLILTFLLRAKKIKDANGNITITNSKLPKGVIIAWSIILVLVIGIVIYIFYDVNIGHQFDNIWNQVPFKSQLEINDDWGTHRGHNWRIAVETFQKFDPFKKLFGFGPDTYLVVSERGYFQEMQQRYGEVYDSAHNEYFNYLICEGVLGLIAYLGMFISGVAFALKSMKKEKVLGACALCTIVYMSQAVVNIAIPITTPVFFTVMYIGVAYYLENRKELSC